MSKKGFVPITILLVLSLIITGIVLVGKNKTPKEQVSDIKQESSPSAIISPTPSLSVQPPP